MDFFEAQAHAERRTTLLIVLFAIAVLAIILTIYSALYTAFNLGSGFGFEPTLFLTVAAAVITLVVGGSSYRTLQLRRGGTAVAELLGGRRVSAQTVDPDEQRLLNVVEEMSIASGVPVPAVYILDREPGINAFAAGHTIHDAAVAVTRGTLESLNRDELQGVIAHEFSHILNGDMRLNIRIIGVLFGILLLATVGRVLIRLAASGSRGSRKKGAGAWFALAGLVLFIVGYIGVFFGRLIQAAISRQREYLADAAAVQFTRNPSGLAGALKLIGASVAGSRIENPHADEVGHLFFAARTQSFFSSLIATHPPLEARIMRLEPGFDGRFVISPSRVRPNDGSPVAGGLEGGGTIASPAVASPGAMPLTAPATTGGATSAGGVVLQEFMDSIGVLTAQHLHRASDLLTSIPEPLRAATRSTEDVVPLLFALLYYQSDAESATRSTSAIREYGGAAVLEGTERMAEMLRSARPDRFTLLGLALPALRALTPPEIEALLPTVDRLIQADGRVDAFEDALSHHLDRQLRRDAKRPAPGSVHSLLPLRSPLEIVLSALAYTGSDDDEAARSALDAASRALPANFGKPTLRSRDRLNSSTLRDSLDRLAAGSPGVRRRVLNSAAQVVAADGVILAREAELLRLIASALDCPVPIMKGSLIYEPPSAPA